MPIKSYEVKIRLTNGEEHYKRFFGHTSNEVNRNVILWIINMGWMPILDDWYGKLIHE